MMNRQTMPLEQIRIAGMEALAREPGIVGMVRVLQQFGAGHGGYSQDRWKWLDDQDMDTLLRRIREKPTRKRDSQNSAFLLGRVVLQSLRQAQDKPS